MYTYMYMYTYVHVRTIDESSFAESQRPQLPKVHVGFGQDEIDLFRLGVEKGDQVGVRVVKDGHTAT